VTVARAVDPYLVWLRI